ncbi:hypothetical protein MCNF_19970 [Mycolicibacterium confluentis]|uniref:Uncharacterized protein n=1 Tax=Mycolicibacterium confluentis TaxID=28047 RepID=A0A7I7XX29_9MYCO|nr:hypothetical protein MCNF_19970 [Mycolicibacterium confluentis]
MSAVADPEVLVPVTVSLDVSVSTLTVPRVTPSSDFSGVALVSPEVVAEVLLRVLGHVGRVPFSVDLLILGDLVSVLSPLSRDDEEDGAAPEPDSLEPPSVSA